MSAVAAPEAAVRGEPRFERLRGLLASPAFLFGLAILLFWVYPAPVVEAATAAAHSLYLN